MAEVHFFMTEDDTRSFVEFLVNEFGARFALDQCDTPDPPVFSRVDQVINILAESEFAPRFFLQSPRWDMHPLITHEVHTKDGRHFFSICPRYGGPTFDFCVAKRYDEGGMSWMVPGFFSDYPWYIVDDSWLQDYSKYRTFDRPEEMAKTYRAVQKYLRRNGVRTREKNTGKTGPWALSGALAQQQRGLWLRQGDYEFIGSGKKG